MKIKKRYLITGTLIITAFVILLCLALIEEVPGNVFPLRLKHRASTPPQLPTGVMPTDLSKFNEQTMHEVRLLSKKQTTYIGITEQNSDIDEVPALKTWVVQLGNFTEKFNALQLSERVESQNFPAFVMMKPVNKISHWIVFVGPSLDKKTAQQWHDTIQKSMKIDGMILSYLLRDTRQDPIQLTKEDKPHVQ